MTDLDKGKELFEQQEYGKAIEVLNSFLLSEENHADALFTRAISYRKIGEFKKSINDLSSVIVRLPEEATLYSERGVSYFHDKNMEEALKDMNKAVELEPQNPYRYSSRAFIRARLDVDGAIEDYRKAVELDPEDAIALNNLGLLEENAGKIKSARKHFEASNKIIGYNPDKRNERDEETKPEANQASLGKVMMNVFTSKATRKEYFKFLGSFFKK